MTRRIQLINLRNPLAPLGGLGHIWRPDSLITLAASLERGGVEAMLNDENLGPTDLDENLEFVGLHLVGAPWIAVAKRKIEEIRAKCGEGVKILIGGQVVKGLKDEEIRALFGDNVFSGMIEGEIERLLGLDKALIDREEVSVRDRLLRIPEVAQRLYISNESSIFIADGCIHRCTFCAANKGVAERYRNHERSREDLETLFELAERYGVGRVSLYATNLDLFQTPDALRKTIEVIKDVRRAHPNVDLRLRGLATFYHFLKTCKSDPTLLRDLRTIGGDRIDFGLDGDSEILRDLKKGFNKGKGGQDLTEEVIRVARNDGVGVGLFMVIGHPGLDTADTLASAYEKLELHVRRDGVVPRPYVATNFVPGGDSWKIDSPQKRALMASPRRFYNLEYAAKANWLKGQEEAIIADVNRTYARMLELPGCPTKIVQPIDFDGDEREIVRGIRSNYGQYDI